MLSNVDFATYVLFCKEKLHFLGCMVL